MKIINNIQSPLCSFKASKLLKEAGMAVPTKSAFNGSGVEMDEEPYDEDSYEESYYLKLENFIYRPTHCLALAWIKVNFKIQLFLDYTYYDGFHYGYKWVKANGDYGIIWKDNDDNPSGCDTAFEATEFAIEYTLENLIK